MTKGACTCRNETRCVADAGFAASWLLARQVGSPHGGNDHGRGRHVAWQGEGQLHLSIAIRPNMSTRTVKCQVCRVK